MDERRKCVVVLGAGMVGGFMARSLARRGDLRVLAFDRDEAAVRALSVHGVEGRALDLADEAALATAVAEADVVVGAMPGFLGYRTAQRVLERGRNLVDISFFPEDPWPLDAIARARGLLAVVDCGVMPGLGGMLALHLSRRLDRADEATIMVGGLPAVRRWPTEYKAPFSPVDVIEEYTRPARLREGGRVVVLPALTGVELVDLPGVGTLEAFNTDGLRTLLTTLQVPNLREKTLRYPGHAERMRLLRDLGFFSESPVEVEGRPVRPIDVTMRLLFRAWRLDPGEQELTVMRVTASGEKDGAPCTLTADILDRTDPLTADSSMSRTTGLPAVVAARLFLDGELPFTGLVPAEKFGEDDVLLGHMLRRLGEAGVAIHVD